MLVNLTFYDHALERFHGNGAAKLSCDQAAGLPHSENFCINHGLWHPLKAAGSGGGEGRLHGGGQRWGKLGTSVMVSTIKKKPLMKKNKMVFLYKKKSSRLSY